MRYPYDTSGVDRWCSISTCVQLTLRSVTQFYLDEDAAQKLAEEVKTWAPGVEPQWGEDGLKKILSCPEVQCCAVVLPIQVQPEIVVRALSAGKHVLQEKPIGATLAEGLATFSARAALAKERETAPLWTIAENFRFENALHEAAKIVKTLGDMIVFQVVIEVPMTPRNKYFSCEWRRDPGFTGAFITDCGVHFVAALRLITGQEVVSVAGLCSHRDQSVPPPDNLTAVMTLENGSTGTMVISYSSCTNKMSWRVVCKEGAVEVERGAHEGKFGFLVTTTPREGAPSKSFFAFSGVEEELRSFAADVRRASKEGAGPVVPDWRGSPEEALKDLAIVEAAVQSGLHGKGTLEVQKVEL